MGSKEKDVQLLGCLGRHGSYSFYKSMKLGGRTYSISSFFPVRIWPDSAILSIAEVQLIWSDRNESLCSLRLYFLPENTPDGRHQRHGEDEVIALQDKVIIRAPDLISWFVEESDWDWGYVTPATAASNSPITPLSRAFLSEKFGKNEKVTEFPEPGSSRVVVLNYERYIRLRTVLKRLEGSPDIANWLSHPLVLALGGLSVGPNCRLLFAKEVFDYQELEDHELLCNHLAPKLKGRPRKKRKRNPSLGSESNESETSSNGSFNSDKGKQIVNGLGTPIKLEKVEKPQSPATLGGHKNVGQYSSSLVIGANSNGLQILKIEPTIGSKGKNGGTKRSHSGGTSNSSFSPQNSDPGSIPEVKADRHLNAELLGPALSELAQKLEKSNALQILPIRPSVIQKPESGEEGHRAKKFKTDPDQRLPNPVFHPNTGERNQKQKTVEDSKPRSIPKGKTGSERAILSITPVDPALKSQVGGIRIHGSPSPFVPTSKIYGDPCAMVGRKAPKASPVPQQLLPISNHHRGESSSSLEILDFSMKRNRTDSRHSLNVNVNVNVNVEPELLDLTVKSGPTPNGPAKHIFHNLANIPPPNAMNQLGLRLTSEVTLFPSNLPQGSKKDPHGPFHPHQGNHRGKREAKPVWRPPGTPTVAQRKEDKSHQLLHALPAPLKTRQREGDKSQSTSGVAQTPSGSKEKNREAEKFSFSHLLHPYYSKMDPAYLSLLSSPFLMGQPGLFSNPPQMNPMQFSMEQIQMYKELLQQGGLGPPPFSPHWPGNHTGKDHRPPPK